MNTERKTIITGLGIWVLLVLFGFASDTSGDYEINWNTIDGGERRMPNNQ